MDESKRLEKSLTLFDVFAICTGAMFSSGFFLLPGIAAAKAGPAVILAYFLASLLIVPAMLSVAELATAMPRAGGAYFFIDRAMGPLVGTVGGLGTWVALVLKSAFALIGMGAYLAIFFDVPVKPLAVGLTVAFAVLNVVGAKETSGLQRILVATLVSILAYFAAMGVFEVLSVQGWDRTLTEFEPFMPFGVDGLFATVGLVFVSYAGLTKVASVAEEVQDPDRNIPLGMALSLFAATVLYCVGVFVMVAVLEPSELHKDLTPVATAGEVFLDFLPEGAGVLLIVIAAIAAFASTGNAGILSASRYPLAMSRDRLVPDFFSKIGRFGTPTIGVLSTAGAMIAILVFLDIEAVVKLASAFQLLVFGMLNLAVIVMRESKIDFYQPGFRSPLYPWVQIAGVVVPMWLVAEMGWGPVAMCNVVIVVAAAWYFIYARNRAERSGAIYHVFERLGRNRTVDLDVELRRIMGEKGLQESDPYDDVVWKADVVDMESGVGFEEALRVGAERLAAGFDLDAEAVHESFVEEMRHGLMPISHGAAVPQHLFKGVDHPEMILMRLHDGALIDFDEDTAHIDDHGPVYAVIFLLSPDDEVRSHLRMLARVAAHIEEKGFTSEWRQAVGDRALKELLADEPQPGDPETDA
jgi:amino acid transporter/mannitol/fructose-specific phosphotransferase system IIA component (Ntr-type)